MDEDWLTTVVEACALEHDLTSFPNGDEVRKGSRH